MNYFKHYILLIKTRQQKNRVKGSEYFEAHHILPKSLGGPNNKANLVLLTPREHFLAHVLLVKFCTGTSKSKMAYALMKMVQNNPQQTRKITSRQYAQMRKIIEVVCSGENHKNYGTKKTKEQKEYLSKLRKGENNPMYGKEPWNKGQTAETNDILKEKVERYKQNIKEGKYTHFQNRPPMSDEAKQKMSKAKKGVPKSEEHKRKISETTKGRKLDPERIRKAKETRQRNGKKQPIVECPHCNKKGPYNSMCRWHFNNCKLHTNNI